MCEYQAGNVRVLEKTVADSPMYMVWEHDTLYVLLRAPFPDSNHSGLISFERENGRLYSTGRIQDTHGVVACHLCVVDSCVYCVNYLSGSVVKMPDCVVMLSGTGVHKKRQEMPHPHYINSFDGTHFLCADLGTDRIYTYDKELRETARVQVPRGHGARHLAGFNDRVYCANELASSVTTFTYYHGILTYHSTVSTLPEGTDTVSAAAAIRVKNGYVYVSNRGHDSIAVFQTTEEGLKMLDCVDCGGRCPRDFNIVDDLLICANELSDTVTFFKLENGIPVRLPGLLKITAPVCVV